MHVGTFTPEGTWRAAAAAARRSWRASGSPSIEMMPIAEFPGRFGWGYDGVDLYAPGAHLRHARRLARVRRSRARARSRRHPRRGLQPPRTGRQLPGRVLARLLHRQVHERLGPGDQLRGAGAGARATSCRTPRYWIEEFHFDGLRLDATQDIKDASPRHVIAEMVAAARAAAGAVPIYVVAENEPQDTILVRDRRVGRLRRGRAVERRRASHRGRRADRPARGLLPRLPGHARRS